MKSGRWLTVFGADYKADFHCPLSIGALSSPRCTGLQPSIGAKAKPITWLSPGHCHNLKHLMSPLRTGYSVLKNNTTSTLLFRVHYAIMSLDQLHNPPLSIPTTNL